MRPELVIDNGMKRAQKYHRWNPVPKELEQQVIEFYLAGNSACSTDKKFGICTQKVLERNGIKCRPSASYFKKTYGKDKEICDAYINGMSAPKIADKFGIKNSRVYKILAKNNIKSRTGKDYRPQSSGKEKDIIEMYQSGISAEDTGVVFGVCEATVLYVLRQNNVTVRRAGIHDVTKGILWKGGVSKDSEYQSRRKNAYKKKRRDSDPVYRLTQSMRSRISSFFRRGKLGKNGKIRKNKKTVELLGADFDTVFKHIESQFRDGMTWDMYGRKGFHIDHKIPLCSAKNEEELMKLLHYSNLQPLWAKDNHKKGGKICL